MAPSHKAFRASRTRPSRPLAQTLSVIPALFQGTNPFHKTVLPAKDCAVPPASASWRCSSIRTSVPVRVHPGTPLDRQCVAHSFGPSRPRPRRRSSHTSRRSLPLLQGACSLPSAALQSPPPPHARPPPRPRSTSFRALGLWETCRRLPQPGQRKRRRHLPHRPFRLQDSQQPRPSRDPRPNASAKSTGITRSKAGKRV